MKRNEKDYLAPFRNKEAEKLQRKIETAIWVWMFLFGVTVTMLLIKYSELAYNHFCV